MKSRGSNVKDEFPLVLGKKQVGNERAGRGKSRSPFGKNIAKG